MNMEKTDTRTRIIEAAADIIGKERNLNLTIRDIAGRAGVNIASINYYFRSKDNLIDEVELFLMQKLQLIYHKLADEALSAADRLTNWADALMKYLIDFPGILFMMGTRVLENRSENEGLADYLRLMEMGLTPAVKELTGIGNEATLSFKVMQLVSGVIYPILIYSGTGIPAMQDMGNDRTRQEYLRVLINSLQQHRP